MVNIITDEAINRRKYWINEIQKLSGNFYDDFSRLDVELKIETKDQVSILLDHVRLCGNIPEEYSHDSSEEKLYSKYTDCILSLCFTEIGLKSLVVQERADIADVEVNANNYAFVADAKAFRLSRTAKNQKDFKVDAMDRWKYGKQYAMVVCPIYQLPRSSSQIYQTATTKNVCIFTYSHLALLLRYSQIAGQAKAQELLTAIFSTVSFLNPSKSATDYWLILNRTILNFAPEIPELWAIEKNASFESIQIAKNLDLHYLASLREKIMKLSHEEALLELVKGYKIDSKIKTINAVTDNGIFTIS